MPYALAASILIFGPQNLLHLDLDNLQQSGIMPKTPTNKAPRIDEEHHKEAYKTKNLRQTLNILYSYHNNTDASEEPAMHYKHVRRIKA